MFFFVLADVLHFLKFIVFYKYLFPMEKKKSFYRTVIVIIIISSTSMLLYTLNYVFINFFIYCAIVISCLFILYNGDKKLIVFSSIWMIFIFSIIDMMFNQIFSIIFQWMGVNDDSVLNLTVAVASLILLIFLGKIIHIKSIQGLRQIKKSYWILFTMLAVADAIVLIFIAISTEQRIELSKLILYNISYILIVVGMFVQLSAVILLLLSREEHKEKKQIIEKYLIEQKEYYDYLRFRDNETKKFRHDLRNHMFMIKTFIDNKQYVQLDEYINLINEKIDTFGKHISVNNDIVDAIINKYCEEARQNQVQIKVRGHFPQTCNVSPYDLCTIFSNSLSNAIDAAKESSNKKIELICLYTENEISIKLINSFSGELNYKNGDLYTTKKNEKVHGFGLINVKECVDKNGGLMNIEVMEDTFVLNILLKNENT